MLFIRPYHISRIPNNGSAVYWSHDTDRVMCDKNTALPLVGFLVTYDTDMFIILSIISVKNEKILNSNNNRSKPKLLRLLWDIVVFRLVAYLLNIISLNLLLFKFHTYRFSYYFDTVLYQFLETGTSDRCLLCIVQRLRFYLIPPLIFPLQSPCC